MTIDVRVTREIEERHRKILTPDALQFVGRIHERFNSVRLDRLADRRKDQALVDSGKLPSFDRRTLHIRDSDYRAGTVPKRLLKRVCEITGNAGNAKTMIQRLNSGAQVSLEDLEDSQSATYRGLMDGQANLYEAVRRTLTFSKPGKTYELGDDIAEIFVRPRGWHMVDKHVLVDGERISASILDASLFLYHNAHELINQGSGPQLYLAKMKNWKEAELWEDVLNFIEEEHGLEQNSIKTTFLVETLGATLQVDEIIYAMKGRCVAVNFGRWDAIFDWMKTFRNWPDKVLPDRSTLTMEKPFLRAASEYMIQTAHRRGILAIDGMSAQIPIKGDIRANADAMAIVAYDKVRGKMLGHDGGWVAHPALVPLVQGIYSDVEANQMHITRDDVEIHAEDFYQVPNGEITEEGIRTNIIVPIIYEAAWLSGIGCVPVFNKMEDVATCEISREQLNNWVRHGAKMADGRTVTTELVGKILTEELGNIHGRIGKDAYKQGHYALAERLFLDMATTDNPPDFLTTFSYEHLD